MFGPCENDRTLRTRRLCDGSTKIAADVKCANFNWNPVHPGRRALAYLGVSGLYLLFAVSPSASQIRVGTLRGWVKVAGDEVWLLGTGKGAFRVDRKTTQLTPLGANTGKVYSIFPIGDDLWLTTEDGAFRVNRKGTSPPIAVGGDTGGVSDIVRVGDEIWLKASKGVFRVDRTNGVPTLLGGTGPPIFSYSGGPSSSRGLSNPFGIPFGGRYTLSAHGGGITGGIFDFVAAGDDLWIGADRGAFHVDRKQARLIPVGGETGRVYRVKPVGDEVWLGAEKGAFRVDRKETARPTRVGGETGTVYRIMPVADEV